MRDPPGDIVFGFALSNLILSIEWIVESLMQLKEPLDPHGQACTVLSYVDLTATLLSSFYNFVFFCFFFMATRSSLRISRIPQHLCHIAPIIATSVGVFSTFSQGDSGFGMSVYGFCNIKTTQSITVQVLNLFIYVITPVFMLYSVKKSLPQCRKVSKSRYEFLRYYLVYVVAISIINVILSVTGIFAAVNLESIYIYQTDNGNDTLVTSRFLGNILRVLRPFILTVIRLYDPNVRDYWMTVFCPGIRKRNPTSLKVNMLGQVQKEDFDGRQKMVTIAMRNMKEGLRNSPFLQQIQHTVRVQVLYSLLASIHYFWRISKKSQLNSYVASSDGFKIDYKKMGRTKERIKINDEMLKKELPEIKQEMQFKDYNTIEGLLTVYGPGIFGELSAAHGDGDELRISLDLSANYSRIIKAGVNKGGKSGEFFFFSYDNKLVIKTISNHELRNLLAMLPKYGEHYKNNPSSLIAKIYGVYSFERVEPYEKYNLILMQNVNGLPSECIERKYDLKGSTYGRQTIKQGNPKLPELKFFDTLKDLDFNKFEKKLHIDSELKEPLLSVLKKDSDFLRAHRLIDYSLVVYIINKESLKGRDLTLTSNSDEVSQDIEPHSYISSSIVSSEIADQKTADGILRNRSISGPTSAKPLKNIIQSFNSMRSIQEDVFYHIGVIDYLIEYNSKKRLEKFGKKLIACDPKLDISVQHPDFYADRFMNYFEKIIKG